MDPINTHLEINLKYYAYCCLKLENLLYIGGMNFIQVYDFKQRKITQTVTASKLIYKLVPIDTKYLLCAGSYILELYRTTDHKMVEVCKFENSIYDVC